MLIFLSQIDKMRPIHLISLLSGLILLAQPAAGNLSDTGHFRDRTAMLSVRSIAQQEDGMIWFGTERSLYSFDGYDLTSYPCPDGHIQTNKLLPLAGSLLLGTNDGVYFFQLDGHGFKRATPFDGELVRDMLTLGDYVYVGSNAGLYRYDPAADTAIRLLEGNIFSLALSGDVLYVGTRSGLGAYKTSGGTYTPLLPGRQVLAASILPDGNTLWIGTPSQLLHFDLGDGRQLDAQPLPRQGRAVDGRHGRRPVPLRPHNRPLGESQ